MPHIVYIFRLNKISNHFIKLKQDGGKFIDNLNILYQKDNLKLMVCVNASISLKHRVPTITHQLISNITRDSFGI